MKVVVLTTSYPRFAGDAAGRFVADAVQHVRAEGVEVEVVSPATFRHYGVAYGSGIVGNLRAQPVRALALPLMLSSFAAAARRAAGDADLVHAHWLPSGLIALSTGKPFVLQLWGTDVELARRARSFARAVVGRARIVVCASTALAEEARALGARDVRVIPSGVDIPAEVGWRLRPRRCCTSGGCPRRRVCSTSWRRATGMRLVVVGDGPLRGRVPQALGFVPHHELSALYARAAVVACPSRREGFGVACVEAMAHGRPVVASAVGGLLDLVVDGETGLLVPPREPERLRAALRTLIDDPELRQRLGFAARKRAKMLFGWKGVTASLVTAYEQARVQSE